MITLLNNFQQKKEKTELILLNIFSLPPIPKIMLEVLKLLQQENTGIQELSKVIAKDQSIVTKILSIANSPLYGLQRKVTSIDFAIMVLGYGEIRNIISALSIMESFKNKTDQYLDQKEFWLHSFLTGSAAKKICEKEIPEKTGEAFIAGFLHDMGISIIHKFFHSAFIVIHEMMAKGSSQAEAELTLLGMTHEQIGSFLLERWNLPMPICEAVLHHHSPENSQNKLTGIINKADCLTQITEIGKIYYDSSYDLNVLNSLKEAEIDELKTFLIKQSESVRYLN